MVKTEIGNSIITIKQDGIISPSDSQISIIIKKLKIKHILNKGNNKITELRTIFQRESQNS
jgi:hypothetical protein